MNNIRTFIICSSAALIGWLAASYNSELESVEAGATAKSPSTAPAVVMNLGHTAEQDRDVASPSLASVK